MKKKSSLLLSILFTLATFSALPMVVTSPAAAHTTLLSSDPVHDSTIQSWPKQITLNFGESLQVLSGAEINKVSVRNARTESVGGTTTVNGNVLTVALAPNTVLGPVLVNYRIASADGHILEGEYSFNYQSSGSVVSAVTQNSHHADRKNFPILASSITLILFGLLLGIFIYRNKRKHF